MATAAANIGIMDGAYFVGRSEILAWINATLQLNLSRVEEAASGAVQCQMMDMTHPGIVPMHKVNFDTKTEYDMIQNYKILQEVFTKLKIAKVVIACRSQQACQRRPLDNLEFLQWLKRYCDSVNGGIMNENYNPVERRCKGGKERNLKGSHKGSKSLQANNLPNSVDGIGCSVSAGANSSGQIVALPDQIKDLRHSVEQVEKERDFYFTKLRDIEILCQTPDLEHLPMATAIRTILYAADAKISPLPEAQELISRMTNAGVEIENCLQEK